MNPILTDERYYHGLLRLEKGEFGMKPLRFTDRQLALYAAASEARETRALCTAGVTLEMMTDAPCGICSGPSATVSPSERRCCTTSSLWISSPRL